MHKHIDYYSILGIESAATDVQIKDAYRKLAKALHPDKNKEDQEFYTKHFQLLNEAKEVLLDPKKKYHFHSTRASGSGNAELLEEISQQKKEIRNLLQELQYSKEKLERSGTQQQAYQEYQKLQAYCSMLMHDIDGVKIHLTKEKRTKNLIIIIFVTIVVFLQVVNIFFTPPSGAEFTDETPFLINNIEFSNSADSMHYTNLFTKKSLRYISPRMKIEPLLQKSKRMKLTIKFINPDGTISKYPSDSKDKFSYHETVWYSPQRETITLHGWGNKSKSFFQTGEYAVEIWFYNRILGKSTFLVVN